MIRYDMWKNDNSTCSNKIKKKLYTKIGTSLNIKNIHSSEE